MSVTWTVRRKKGRERQCAILAERSGIVGTSREKSFLEAHSAVDYVEQRCTQALSIGRGEVR
jgi:hypothetical protein